MYAEVYSVIKFQEAAAAHHIGINHWHEPTLEVFDGKGLCSVLVWSVLSVGLFSTFIINFFKPNVTAAMISGAKAEPITDKMSPSFVFPFVISIATANDIQ